MSVRPRKSYTWNERGSISATASRPLGFEPALTVPDTAGRSRLQYRFVSVEEVRRGDLGNGSYRILMLPHTIALSPIEAKKIKDFVEQGGVVVADGQPGIFDEHGRRLAEPALSEIFAGSATHARTGKGEAFYAAFPVDRGRESGRGILVILKAAGVKPRFQLSRLDGGAGKRCRDPYL